MIKSAELAGPSCLTRAADDEPLFVLRANDYAAPGLVREWAVTYRLHKGGEEAMTSAQMAKYAEALLIASQMEHWKRKHP